MVEAYTTGIKHYVFFSRSTAARDAIRRGIKAFETMLIPGISDYDPSWTWEERPWGPGIEFARLFAEDKDYVSWCEVTKLEVPRIVVTCHRDEITDTIPDLLEVLPITPSLWDKSREYNPAARAARMNAPQLDTEVLEIAKTIDPAEMARQLVAGELKPKPTPAQNYQVQAQAADAVSGSLSDMLAKIVAQSVKK